MRRQPPLNFDNDPRDDEIAELREKLRAADDTLVRLKDTELERIDDQTFGEDPDIPRFSFDARPGLYLVTIAWVITIRIAGFAVIEYMGATDKDMLDVLNKVCALSVGLAFLAWIPAECRLHGWLFISRLMWAGLGLCVNSRILGREPVSAPDTALIWAVAVFCLLMASSSAVPYALAWLQRFLDHPRKTLDEVNESDKARSN